MPRSYSVHPKYIKAVNLAWKRKFDGRDQDLADELGRALTLVIVNLFLKGEPVNRVNFTKICQILELNWQEIAGLNLKESPETWPILEIDLGKTIESSRALSSVSAFNPTVELSAVDAAINELVGTLCEMLRRITRKAGDLLRADRTSIFLLDEQRKELGSLIADDGHGGCLLIDIPADKGIAGLAASSLQVINIPFDVYDDPRSQEAQNTDKKTMYRTYTMLAWPLLNKDRNLVAVVQLINKLKPNYLPEDELFKRIDTQGFTQEDEAMFAKFAPSIIKILEKCQFCYQLAQDLRKNPAVAPKDIYLHNSALIKELQRREEQLRMSLNKI
ncbi:MAG: GAF domain-containing protein [Potamolinea sp.]